MINFQIVGFYSKIKGSKERIINTMTINNNYIDDREQTLNLDLDGFSGPLDLLLTLAQNKKLDITKISINIQQFVLL